MPQGETFVYTAKQKRKAQHHENRGIPHKEAEKRAWTTVNKQDGGGLKK